MKKGEIPTGSGGQDGNGTRLRTDTVSMYGVHTKQQHQPISRQSHLPLASPASYQSWQVGQPQPRQTALLPLSKPFWVVSEMMLQRFTSQLKRIRHGGRLIEAAGAVGNSGDPCRGRGRGDGQRPKLRRSAGSPD